MGTANSISKDINSTVKESQDESSEYECKIFHSLKDNNSKYLSQGHTESTFNTKNEINEEKIPFKFEWIEGGSEVFIAGTFLDNWKTFKRLEKNSATGIFEVIIYISKDIHQFKFIIDNIWKCSRNYKIVYDYLIIKIISLI
jgi:5'-AMP-activated protein kinase regulatory beta subunit